MHAPPLKSLLKSGLISPHQSRIPSIFFRSKTRGGEEDNQRVRRFNGRSIDGNAQFLPRYFQREGEGAANISIGPSIIVLWNSPYSFEADLPSLNLNSITPDLYSLFPMNIQTVRGGGGEPAAGPLPPLPVLSFHHLSSIQRIKLIYRAKQPSPSPDVSSPRAFSSRSSTIH